MKTKWTRFLLSYLDSALGDFAWYRRRRGGTWREELEPDFSGWPESSHWVRDDEDDEDDSE